MGTCLLQSVSSRFNTASSKYCCNCLSQLQRPNHEALGFNTASGKYCCNQEKAKLEVQILCFNNASGKYCCNGHRPSRVPRRYLLCFNTASGKYCCNSNKALEYIEEKYYSFNTASGKYCCNFKDFFIREAGVFAFQYRKR